MKSLRIFVLVGLAAMAAAPAFCDWIETKDGSRVMGEVIHMKEGSVILSTAFAGELEISWEQIAGIETEEAKPIHLDDGSVIHGSIEVKDDGRLEVVRGVGKTRFPITIDEVAAIAPPAPPTPTPVSWKGKVVGSLNVNQGNTELTDGALTVDMSRRNQKDRYTVRGGYFFAENNGDDTRDEQFLSAKYDYFFNKQLYSYFTTRFDRDIIRALDLRTSAGAGAGYQFWETEVYNLSGELGISYVNEDYDVASDDEDYIAARIGSHFDWWIIKDKLQYTQNAELLPGLQDVEDWYAIFDAILTWQWSEQWSMNGGVRLQYDNTPAVGQKEEDIEYLLGVGYSF